MLNESNGWSIRIGASPIKPQLMPSGDDSARTQVPVAPKTLPSSDPVRTTPLYRRSGGSSGLVSMKTQRLDPGPIQIRLLSVDSLNSNRPKLGFSQ